MRHKTRATLSVAIPATVIAVLSTVSLGQTGRVAPPPSRGNLGALGRGHANDPEVEAFARRLTDLDNRGRQAEKEGDLATAERLYRQIGNLMPHTPRGPIPLAPLYDKMGRDHDAYLQYRLAVADYGTRATSHRDDPRLLARYGDLSLRYGGPREARLAYALASTLADRQNTPEPDTVPRDDSLACLKAAAHTAASIQNWGVGKWAEALADLDIATRSDPSYWIARYYLASDLEWDGRHKEAIREAILGRTARAKRRCPREGRGTAS